MLSESQDEDMLELAKEELKSAEEAIPGLEEELKLALLPQDPNDDKNVFIEIRPAAGGNESSLFSQELLRSYVMYAQSKEWKTEIVDQQDNDS
jgi:peptide chain release factor 1